MPSANVDFVRSIYSAWERGDFSSVEWANPDIEFVVVDGPTPGGGRGLASMAEAMVDYVGPWEGYRIEVEDCRALDNERVLVLIRQRGRGRTSGMELAGMRTDAANVLHIRDGKVTSLAVYWDRERAFTHLGLAPEAGGAD
jgi:ketosteroid isomerase-like protein